MDTPPLHILVYDESSMAENLLKEFAPIFNFAYTIETDLNKLRNLVDANALLIVENATPEKLFAFLGSGQIPPSLPVVYFAEQSKDAKSFRKLKQELHVNYVVQQPIDANECAALLRTLFSHKENPSLKEYLTPELLAKYEEKIFEKIERIEELINLAREASDFNASLLEIRNEIHKITGNAAPYGFPEAGKLCGAHEIYLYGIYSGTKVYEVLDVIKHNEAFLKRLKLYFQKIYPRVARQSEAPGQQEGLSEWQRRASDQKRGNILIHLITHDFDLARYFQAAAAKKHVNLIIEDNPDTYLKNFPAHETPPDIILVEEQFPFIKCSGMDVIKKIQAGQTAKKPLFVILTEWDNLDKRIEWMKQGVDLILKKPITDDNIDSIFTQAFEKRGYLDSKILIVDDDESQGLLMKNVFENAHLTAFYLQNENKLFLALEEYSPDLLILDIQMPKYDGRVLLNALREDVRYKHLLIVIVTALSPSEIDEWAYTAQCDAIVHKPLDIPIFLPHILALLEKQRGYLARQQLDPLTGLFRWSPFLQLVDNFVSQCPKGTKCAFVLMQIDQWDSLSKTLNSSESGHILVLFADLLKSHFFSSLFKGILSKGCFAFLFKELTGGEIEFLLESFYEKIGSKIWISTQTHLKITASSSIVLFASGENPVQEVVDEAKSALLTAADEEKNRVAIRRIGEKVSVPTAVKQIIIIDDDPDLCDIIRFAFEKHGFPTKVFHNATDALHFFAQLQALDTNTLLILDRQLPDGDGIHILRKIRDKFPGPIKAIFLSSLSTEKEILESLRAGALDYVTKPFSPEVLIEKASILLNK